MFLNRSFTRSTLLGSALVGALALAACGGDNRSGGAAASPASIGPAATVDVATSRLGSILVDSGGRTLYLFKADSGTTSACQGACAVARPPLRATGTPTAGTGATAALLATTGRSDGGPEVTYNGHPLYLYAGDQKAGDVKGQGLTAFGGEWLVVSPAGSEVASAPPQSSGSGGGNGY
jgi:predicted lipoprotein with Yx(FWY)xxD motif